MPSLSSFVSSYSFLLLLIPAASVLSSTDTSFSSFNDSEEAAFSTNFTTDNKTFILPEVEDEHSLCVELCTPMQICESNVCRHKGLFSGVGFESRDGLTTGIIFTLFAATAAAGTGGGGVLVPVFIVLEQFLPKDAVAISQSTIFGGALANLLWNVRARHPRVNRPLISLELGLMMEPTTLAGTVAGVLLNRLLPSWALLGILVILLGLTLIRACQNAWKKWKKNRVKPGSLQEPEPEPQGVYRRGNSVDELIKSFRGVSSDDAIKPFRSSLASEVLVTSFSDQPEEDWQPTEESRSCCSSSPSTLSALLKREESLQLRHLCVYVATWITIVGFSICKGGASGSSVIGVRCGELRFWLLNAGVLPVIVILQCFIARHLSKLDAKKEQLGYEFLETDVRWKGKNTVGLPCVSYLVGVFAGMLGIGGGLFKAPLLNEMGADSQVVGATCSFMIFFTSSISMAQYIIFGALKTDYALWFGGVGFVSSLVGQAINSCILRRFNTASHLDLGVAAIIGCSFVLLLVQGILTIQEDLATGAMGFSELCAREGSE